MKKNAVRQRLPQATPLQLAVSGGVGILLSYAFVTRALDTASYWLYLGSILFLILGIKLIARSFKNYYGKG